MLVQGVQAGTSKPFHVNFISCYTTDAHIDVMVELKPAAVSFHWGHPGAAWIETLHGAGIDVWEQVGTVADADKAASAGVDAIVVQGSEAGGHNYGSASTLTLTPAVVDAVGGGAGSDGPLVIASGGISDGRGLAAALMLGADGAWVGTRFVATQESSVADEYKARLVSAGAGDTVRTHLFGRQHPDFNPIRVLRNRVVEEWDSRVAEIPADNSAEPVVGQMDLLGEPTELRKFTNMVPMTGATGDFEELPLLAGEGVGLVRDLGPRPVCGRRGGGAHDRRSRSRAGEAHRLGRRRWRGSSSPARPGASGRRCCRCCATGATPCRRSPGGPTPPLTFRRPAPRRWSPTSGRRRACVKPLQRPTPFSC
jgi:NAD(P)H-dependent flavin oxidoreductase YrpB (nitropropane dioxygenase family)